MDLLFLDIDGVANDHSKLPGSVYCGIQLDRVAILNRILYAVPDTQLVISSAWRYMLLAGDMTLRGFEYLLNTHGVHAEGRLHGCTCSDEEIEPHPQTLDQRAWRAYGLRVRPKQILRYVNVTAFPCRKFAVLDDLPLKVPHLVQTDGAVGITNKEADLVVSLLM